jgi:thioredoxin reductase (NADPH)
MHARPIVDCLVVGAGPAGLTAGLYLRRFLRDVVLVDAGNSRARQIPESNNYPGFPNGINGDALLTRLREQLMQARGSVIPGTIESLRRADVGFVALVGDRDVASRTVVLATGVCNLEPALDGIEAVRRDGLLRQCPICDAYEFAGKRMVVIGDDRHCVREAAFLRHYTDDITVIGTVPDSRLSIEQRGELERLGIASGDAHAVAIMECDDRGIALRLSDSTVQRFDVLYSAMGTQPQSELARQVGARLDELGNVVVDAHCETNVPGFYAAGDVVSALDQLAVATGHAAIAATAIHNRLRTLPDAVAAKASRQGGR